MSTPCTTEKIARVCANAESERDDDNRGEAWITKQAANSVGEILPEIFEEIQKSIVHRRLLFVFDLLARGDFLSAAKLRRNLLGVTRKRRAKARVKESGPLKPTDSATVSIEVSPADNRRRASLSRKVSTKVAGDEPKCSLKRRKNCRGDSEARCASDSTDISSVGLFVIHATSSAKAIARICLEL